MSADATNETKMVKKLKDIVPFWKKKEEITEVDEIPPDEVTEKPKEKLPKLKIQLSMDDTSFETALAQKKEDERKAEVTFVSEDIKKRKSRKPKNTQTLEVISDPEFIVESLTLKEKESSPQKNNKKRKKLRSSDPAEYASFLQRNVEKDMIIRDPDFISQDDYSLPPPDRPNTKKRNSVPHPSKKKKPKIKSEL